MTHRQSKMVRSKRVRDFCQKLTTYGKTITNRYPFGKVGKTGYEKRIRKPSRHV